MARGRGQAGGRHLGGGSFGGAEMLEPQNGACREDNSAVKDSEIPPSSQSCTLPGSNS